LHARCNAVAHALKVSDDVLQAKGEMADDIFEEAPFWPDFVNDPGDVWPEVAGIILAFSHAG
jgi:hypothetical protein